MLDRNDNQWKLLPRGRRAGNREVGFSGREVTASVCKHANTWVVINVTFDPPVNAAGAAKCADIIRLIRVFPCPQIQTSCCLLALVCHHTESAEVNRQRGSYDAFWKKK